MEADNALRNQEKNSGGGAGRHSNRLQTGEAGQTWRRPRSPGRPLKLVIGMRPRDHEPAGWRRDRNENEHRGAGFSLCSRRGHHANMCGNTGPPRNADQPRLKDPPDLTYVMAIGREKMVVSRRRRFSALHGKTRACNVHVAPGSECDGLGVNDGLPPAPR